MNCINYLTEILMATSTVAVAILTYSILRATQLQFVASMTVSFQNEWHSSRATLMRDYLHSNDLVRVLNVAIKESYGTSIEYTDIRRLLDTSELKGPQTNAERLAAFEGRLKQTLYRDPVNSSNVLFSAYQALYEILLSFDRLAAFRDEPMMFKRCIVKYRPPIRDLSPQLQAFIAVRIVLRPKELKNYKKDYMHMLALLDVESPPLFQVCKQGLLDPNRAELTPKEEREWNAIQKRHA